VRAASTYSGEWPSLSAWHGTADQTVDQSNASGLIAQWRTLHGAPAAPAKTGRESGHQHHVWFDARGREVVKEYRIEGLGHGTPLDPRGSKHGEKAGPFMLDAGISSTRLIARFWGLVPAVDNNFIARDGPEPEADVSFPRSEFTYPFERRVHWADD